MRDALLKLGQAAQPGTSSYFIWSLKLSGKPIWLAFDCWGNPLTIFNLNLLVSVK